MDALRKYGFAILLGLSLFVILLVGIFWVFMNARSYQGQASGLAKTANELRGFAQRKPDSLPTEKLLDAYRKHRDAMAAAADQASAYLDGRFAKFQLYWGEKNPPRPDDFMSRYKTDVRNREKAYRARFQKKTKAGEDEPVLLRPRATVSEAELPQAMKELYMFLAIADAALKREIGDLTVNFIPPQTARTAPASPGAAPAARPPYELVKAEVACRGRWANLFAFLDDLYADGVVPFEVTRLVVGKTYESLQKETVKQLAFDTKEKATNDPGVGPDPALDVLSIELVAYDWKGEQPPAAPPAGK